MHSRKMWILGSFGDPREFSHHSKAVLSNLIEPVFHLQPLLLKAVWFGVLKTNALYHFSLHLQMLTLVNADHRALYEKRIPFLKNIHFHQCLRGVWAVTPSLCLSPWPRVQCRLQMGDCNHCKILPHLPGAKWLTYKTSNDSDLMLFGYFPPSLHRWEPVHWT